MKEVKTMKKAWIASGLAAVMILGVTYAFAQGPGTGPGRWGRPCLESGGPGPGQGPRAEKWASLTPDQRTKFKGLRQKFVGETAQVRGNILAKRLELQSLWSDPKADDKAIMDKAGELRGLQSQMREKAVQMRLEARKILTPEQLAEFGSGWGMGPGMGHGMGPGMGRGFEKGVGPGRGYGCGPCN